MNSRRVKDVMVPLDRYAVVSQHATLLDAVRALEEAQTKLAADRQPYRAILVVDEKRRIVGKVGQLALLTALEPRYSILGDLGFLSRAGVSEEVVSSMMEHYRFFQEDLTELCSRVRALRVKDVMRPATHSIDENATLAEAIHKIVMWQTLSILVTRGNDMVGLLRLSDVFDEITARMKATSS